MASRRAGRFRTSDKEAARESFDLAIEAMATEVDVVADNQPADPLARRVAVVDTGPGELAALRAALSPDVIVEPEILHFTETCRPTEFVDASRTLLAGPVGTGVTVRITVTGGGQTLAGATVSLFLRGLGGLRRQIDAVTTSRGRVSLSFGPFFQPTGLVVVPAGGHWAVVERNVKRDTRIDCPPLPAEGPVGWWHRALGVKRWTAKAGGGVRVAVIDTGVGPHPALHRIHDVGAFIAGGFDPAGGADVAGHGTHVAGIIAARPALAERRAGTGWGGLAPGVRLYSARVFPPGEGANQADIANAIDHLSRDRRADLINLSLGSPNASQIEHDAILDALERGTLCVCAAANSAGPVEYPAAFPETVAVSALGRLGWGPPGTMAATRLPQDPGRFGSESLYLANFSCFGPEVTCAGPGVGIISTLPAPAGIGADEPGPYGAMDGTSMASPAVVGLLARLLAGNERYQSLPGDQSRAEMARAILVQACHSVDLAPAFQGSGLPRQS
jgi:subtilisin family serine protease